MIEKEEDEIPEQPAQSHPATEAEEVKQPCSKKSRKLNPLPVGRPVRVYGIRITILSYSIYYIAAVT